MDRVNTIEAMTILGFAISFVFALLKLSLSSILPKRVSDFLIICGIWNIEVYLVTKFLTNLWN